MRALRIWSIPLLLVGVLVGCGEEKRVVSREGQGSSAPASVSADPDSFGPAKAPKKEIKLTPILGKKTTDIKNAQEEIQKNNAQQAPGKITAKDPITMGGNAYVVAVDQIAAMNIQHAIDLYEATEGHYPRNYKEFMDGVIKPGQPDGIALPKLPYYQEYGYDEKQHKLMVMEYPDRKAQFQEQQDKRFGR